MSNEPPIDFTWGSWAMVRRSASVDAGSGSGSEVLTPPPEPDPGAAIGPPSDSFPGRRNLDRPCSYCGAGVGEPCIVERVTVYDEHGEPHEIVARTRTGRVLTDADIWRLAAEADDDAE